MNVFLYTIDKSKDAILHYSKKLYYYRERCNSMVMIQKNERRKYASDLSDTRAILQPLLPSAGNTGANEKSGN